MLEERSERRQGVLDEGERKPPLEPPEMVGRCLALAVFLLPPTLLRLLCSDVY